MNIMCSDISEACLSVEEYQFLSQFKDTDISIQDIWKLMDDIWDELDITNYSKDAQKITAFYRSPVWLLNGIFTDCDQQALEHRTRIAAWVAEKESKEVLDYGGGYGSLARKIASVCTEATVSVLEPYPTEVSKQLNRSFPNLQYVDQLPAKASMDVALIQDVLEHVPDPLATFSSVLDVVKPGKYLVTANCFHPVIKCHLPETFHFRYSFKFVVTALGCRYLGRLPGVEHAQIFQKTHKPHNWRKARWMEKLSRAVFPLLDLSAKAKK